MLCAGLPLDGTTGVGVGVEEVDTGAAFELEMLCAGLPLDGTTGVGVEAEVDETTVPEVDETDVDEAADAGVVPEVGGTAVIGVAAEVDEAAVDVEAELAPGAVLNGVAASWSTAFFSFSMSARFCASKLAKQACVG